MLSVIIPAYNAEKTIEKAVQSAVREIPDGEILIVENGSTDGTVKTAQALAERFGQIRILHSPKGVSAARNAGLEAAKGEWVLFLDADDIFAEGSGEVFRRCSEKKETDLWLFGHVAGLKKRSVTNVKKEAQYAGADVESARVRMLEDPTRYMQVWAKLFKTELIRKNRLFFKENLSLAEDSDFTLRYSALCSNIVFSSEITYLYSLDAVSTMRSPDTQRIQKYVFAMEETGKTLEGEPERIQKAFRKYVLMHLNIAMVRGVYRYGNGATHAEKQALLKKTVKEPVFADAIRKIRVGECFYLRMMPVILLKMHWYSAVGMIYSARARQNARREGLR